MIAGILGFIITLAVLAFLAYVLVRVVKKRGGFEGLRFDQPPVPPTARPVDALALLDERLAKGDIDVDDYRARRAALMDGGFPSFTATAPTEPPPPPTRSSRAKPTPPAPEA